MGTLFFCVFYFFMFLFFLFLFLCLGLFGLFILHMCVSFWLWIARALLSLMLMTLISGVAALSVAVWPADGVGDDYGGEHMTMTLLLAVSIFR